MLTALSLDISRSNVFSNVRQKRIKESRKKDWKQENTDRKVLLQRSYLDLTE